MTVTQLARARRGEITEEVRLVAQEEGLPPEELRERLARGRVVIPANIHRECRRPLGIGEGLRVKVNANLGTSAGSGDPDHELAKLKVVEAAGADAVMDLSTVGDLDRLRRTILAATPLTVGTVPLYQLLAGASSVESIAADAMIAVIEHQARQGVDFATVHCGVTRAALPLLAPRLTGVVSRGGASICRWMAARGEENPFHARFDDILSIARQHDLTLSLGDGLRPGSVADATDAAQLHELRVLGELTRRARRAEVQVIVEGPGHLPLDQIARNVALEQELCEGAPFFVLGPLATDLAPGYDHITGAIGGALAAWAGAAFLCTVTPAEHLRLPSVEDVREGVIAGRIAAHCADLARGAARAWARDRELSRRRSRLDWEGMFRVALDGEKPARYRQESAGAGTATCSMCGELCALRTYHPTEVIS